MKTILLHTVPVVVLALAAIFSLTTEEQNTITQGLTAVIGFAFAVSAIVVHHKK